MRSLAVFGRSATGDDHYPMLIKITYFQICSNDPELYARVRQ